MLRAAVPLLVLSFACAGCALQPIPLTDEENASRVKADLSVVMLPQEPITAPITMPEAMARALKYNLDERVKLMEMAVANNQLDLSRFDMLPKIVADVGYSGRNNDAGSQSFNLSTNSRSDISSTSTDQHRRVADLGMTWNILDFGVSYLRARQNADLALVAEERKRRVVQGILQDIRISYWRAVAAERLLTRIEPLEKRVDAARRNSRTLERRRIQSPLESLTYQRTLVDTLRQLQILRRELSVAKSQLAALMGLPPGQSFEIAVPPPASTGDVPTIKAPVDALESFALLNRPELREESYNARISADDTWKALVKMLPGVDVSTALRYDSNSFLVHKRWADYGTRVSWNLLNVASLPATMAFAEAQQDVVAARRQALSIAVLTQVRVAMAQFDEISQEFALTAEQSDIERRIQKTYRNAGSVGQQGELGVIQAEASSLVSDLRRDLSFAELQNAYAKVMVSAGIDPLPDTIPADDLATVSKAVEDGMKSWEAKASATARIKDIMTAPDTKASN
jgi:outer membrane protein TolC